MNNLRKTLLTGLAALSLGGAMLGAQAQSQAPDAHPKAQLSKEERQAKWAGMKAKHEQMRAQRVAQLHDDLRITPAQENAWNAFVASMKPGQHAGGHRGDRGDRTAAAGLSAPQRAEQMLQRQKARIAQMEQRVAALNSFYSVLSPEQKKVFDDKAAQLQSHMGRHGMHGGMHGDGKRGGADAARG